MGRGTGKIGYYNLAPMDSHIHSLSAKGVRSYILPIISKHEVHYFEGYYPLKKVKVSINKIEDTDELDNVYPDMYVPENAYLGYDFINYRKPRKDKSKGRIKEYLVVGKKLYSIGQYKEKRMHELSDKLGTQSNGMWLLKKGKNLSTDFDENRLR